MTDKYNSNGDYSTYGADFKRKATPTKQEGSDNGNEEPNPQQQKANEYIRELLAEKSMLDESKYPHAVRLIEQEIQKAQSTGKVPPKESKYVDIYRERPVKVSVKVLVPVREHPKFNFVGKLLGPKESKYVDIYRERPVKVSVKVLVPVREHPKFNFVGKLLGPKGNSMKRLQDETMCKMAVLGRGSMKDRQKEEELRQSLDPKFAHLSDDLHVEISALGPPAEAHARVAFALAEVRKYLIPDNNDNIRQEQMREMEIMTSDTVIGEGRTASRRPPGILRSAVPRPPVPMRTATRTPVVTPRVMPAKTKILSILDRARIAMEESYGYEDPYDPVDSAYDHYTSAPSGHSRSSYSAAHYDDVYDTEYYRESSASYGI
ncbi:KH domain [Popillia japonica]|uniref:KH domain n=1 Tax=Popillia japonica TaxID=7064 RepID=A0AAW1JFI7_POPJA